ncbi:conserved hypothetical protein [Candidatus Brocadia pituitae]|nr:conserved hypothetical protein [Candidatus Brocadia pituitae]
MPGRKTAYSLNIPLSGTSIPASLKSIELEVTVAGRIFTESFAPAPNLTHLFTWDGNDAYGRTVQGTQPVTVRIGYTYQGVYQQVERFGYNGNGIPITGDQTREEVTLWQEWKVAIGIWNNLSNGLGHWCLDVNHSYNPSDGSVYYGNGTSSKTKNKYGDTISSISGGVGDGGQATAAKLLAPEGIVIGNDGSVYFADTWNHRIRRVGTDGIITTVAGNGSRGFSGDGGQATAASLNVTRGIALGSDGTIYIADSGNSRIRRVGTDGIITTVAGTGLAGFNGDGRQARTARLSLPEGVVIGSDGSIYIADTFNHRIRRVGLDGIITTVAGTGDQDFSGDGGQATEAMLNTPMEIAIGGDGSIYIADSDNHRIRLVGTDGIITTVAGNGNQGFSGDGGQATAAMFSNPAGIAIRSDGSIYIADMNNHRIRLVGTDGIITTVVGNGGIYFGGDGDLAIGAMLTWPVGIAIGNDGSIYIADHYCPDV